MARVTLFGASGYTGRLVARTLDAHGLDFVAAGRDPARVSDAVEGLEHVSDVRRADADEPSSLRDLCADTDVLVTTVGPFSELGRPVLDAAIASGCHYLDCTGEQPFLRWAFRERARAAADAGITAIPACGFDFVPGDLLADVAAREIDDAGEVHVAYLVRGPGMIWSRGTRSSAAAVLDEPVVAFDDDELVEEGIAEVRRLCWFPKPVGPQHGASFPGGEALMVPRHVPSVRTVRTYLAVPGVLAEAGQLAGRITGWAPARRLAERVLRAGSGGPSEERRRKVRWACVVEAVAGEADPSLRPDERGGIPPEQLALEGRVARAWAYGYDIYATTAQILVAAAAKLARGDGGESGVRAPAEVFDAVGMLDELSDASGLRWSLSSTGGGIESA